nr:reverse transcriptase domain-containing protein [Tanacetum cinerariifolium]
LFVFSEDCIQAFQTLKKKLRRRISMRRVFAREADAFLGLEDDPDSPKINPFYYDPEGDILLLEAILNSEPSPPLPNQEQNLPSFKEELNAYEAQTVKTSVDEPPEVKLKDLPHHLEYTFLKGDNKLPVIIAKELRSEEKAALIKGDNKLPVIIAKELRSKEKAALIKVLKSHKRAIAWKLSDIQGINPEFCTHKILMEEDYKAVVQRQRRTLKIKKRPHSHVLWTFAYRRMPFGLCNAPGTFQRYIMAIFHDMIKKTMEVFMDDFLVFGNSFNTCQSHLDKMLKRCEDTNLCLNWEKSHFIVKEGIVLGHKISKNGIEVDKAKVDVIAKLPHPNTVKGIQSFLSHAGFYRRFI